MPATDCQGSSAIFGRSILSIRRDQVHSMDPTHDTSASASLELESFQKQVTDRFVDLVSVSSDDLLSLSWMRKLLDSFLCIQDHFRLILLNNKSSVSRPPVDRLVNDFFERSVKALDLCNAIRDGIEQIRGWKKFIEIVLCALDTNNKIMIGEGQFRRAKKALVDLSISMLDERESIVALAHRNRSFGRQNVRDHHHQRNSLGHFRSLSWSVSRSWSAARQLQAIGNNLAAPKGNEISNGIAVAVYTMNSVLLFVMWAMVAAIPCQDRGLQVHFYIPRHFAWSAGIMSLHERVMEESRRRDRRNACGLLREIYRMDKCAKGLTELADAVQFPLAEEKEAEVRARVQELGQVCEVIKEGLDPLERQVRDVFHRIVHSRTEGLDSMGRVNHHD